MTQTCPACTTGLLELQIFPDSELILIELWICETCGSKFSSKDLEESKYVK